jgi:hypothetical protein
VSALHPHNGVTGPFRVDLQNVRRLDIHYSRARPDKAKLVVEYVGGRIKVFEVDRFLIERLLEHLEEQRM